MARDDLNYADFFGGMRTLGELLRSGDARPWTTAMPRTPEQHRYVVWLGCNILRTAHIAESLDDILRHLKTDFVTLGGPSSCCGIFHRQHGDTDVGNGMLAQTLKKFDAFTPDRLLWWCPSCDNELRSAAAELVTDTATARGSVTTFLASQIDRFAFTHAVPVRVAFHAHIGTPEQDADFAAATALLRRVPGLVIIDVPPLADRGRHCTDKDSFRDGKEAYAHAVGDWFAAARAAGATEIVTIYHSCHRQLLLAQRNLPAEARMDVTNYLTFLARSLGLPERTDRFAEAAAADSVETMLDALRSTLADRAIDPARAEKALKAQFG